VFAFVLADPRITDRLQKGLFGREVPPQVIDQRLQAIQNTIAPVLGWLASVRGRRLSGLDQSIHQLMHSQRQGRKTTRLRASASGDVKAS